MATSLQRQLAALAAPSSALLIPDRKTVSVLFSVKEAAGHRRDTFHSIGLDGLDELIDINPRLFQAYRSSRLFNKESVEFERIVSNTEENNELNEEIEHFLIALSPYFMLPAAIKCIEWLVNRFHIQKFNISSILQCILPYYDTKNFALVIRVLEIEQFKTKENQSWSWLTSTVKAALPLSKTILFSKGDPNFINWLFSTLKKFIEVHASHPSALQSFICFITSTITGILNSILHEIPKRKDKNLRRLNRSKGVIHSLWSQMESLTSELAARQLKTATISQNDAEIICMIYVTCSFLGLIGNQRPELNEGQQKLVGKTMMHILKNYPQPVETQTFLLMNLLTPLGTKALKLRKEELIPILLSIELTGQRWDLYHFISRILLDNISFRRSGLTPSRIWSVVEICDLTPTQRSQLLRNLYEKLNVTSATKKWVKGFLSKLERQYPIEFELMCEADPQFATDLIKHKTGQNLFVTVQHSDPALRRSAVIKLLKRFKKKVEKKKDTGKLGDKEGQLHKIGRVASPKLKGIKPDSNATAQALLTRFQDDDPNVVKVLLKLKVPTLLKLFTAETLIEQLTKIVQKRLTVKCTKRALKQLCLVAFRAAPDGNMLMSKVLAVLIPLLFPTKDGLPTDLALIILKSKFAKNNDFLKSYAALLEKEKLSSAEICEFSFNEMKCSKLLIDSDDTFVSKIFTLLPLIAPGDIDRIVKLAESVPCKPTGIYPVRASNFSQCLKLAEKKGVLTLDFVFTTIMNLKFKVNSPLLAKVFKFVWYMAEAPANRNLCVQFLADFVAKSFSSAEEQMNFWCMMARTVFEDDKILEEFHLLRILQSLSICLEKNPKPLEEYMMKSGISQGKTGRVSTRSQAHAQPLPVSEPESKVQEQLFEILLSRTLYHDSHRIRTWGLNCLSIVSNACESENVTSEFIKAIFAGRSEIIADKEHAVIIVSKTLEKSSFSTLRDRFIEIILTEFTEKPIAIGLLKLCQPISSKIFSRFLPTAKNLISKNPESKMLQAVLDCYDPHVDHSLEIVPEALRQKQTHIKILSKLTREAVESGDVKWRKALFGIIVRVVLECENPMIKVAIQRCVRKWILEASIISEELDKCIQMEKVERSSSNPAAIPNRKTKPQQRLANGNVRELLDQSNWGNRTEVVLELIQSKKRLIRKTKLIRPLFKLLKICIGLEEQSPVEYLKQLILTSLTLCCSDDKTQESNDDWIDFNVETVIDCLRCSRNPQTHHHALILLNYAAQLYPEQVLHGVMSLFTFMGNSILRQDDTYSTQLIQQTVTTVVPTFVSTNVVQKYSITRVSAGIYFAFASALQDIPVHRRLPVFTSLVETLEPAKSMWQLCVIIIDKALMRDKKRSNLTNDMELAIEIVGKFPPEIAVLTLEKIYTYLSQLPIYNCSSEEFHVKRLSQNPDSKAVVDLMRKDSLRDVEILVYFTLELVLKIGASFADLEDTNKLNYDALLEKCLSYSRLVSNIHEDKIFRLITQRNLDIIEKLNAALEPSDLVRTVESILGREDLGVKRKVLEMLNYRIAHKFEWFGNPEILLELVDPLVDFCQKTATSDEAISVIQTAFISLKLISKHIASVHPDRFVPVFDLTFKQTTHDENRLLRASAFACLGELFTLKSLILPNLNAICDAILKAFKASAKMNAFAEQNGGTEGLENGTQEGNAVKHETEMSISVANLLCISTLTCLTKLCDHLGSFLGAKFLQKSLVQIFHMDGIFGQGEKATNRKKIFDQRVKAVLKSIATKIPLRNLLPSLRKVFQDVIAFDDFHHTNSIVLLIEVLKETLTNTPKPDFTTLFPMVCDSFLTDFLAYREQVSKLEKSGTLAAPVAAEDLVQVENTILESLTNGIVLKVSESVFRSFYHKMFDWAGENLDRLITFYRFSTLAAEKLKSLFVTFSGYVLSHGAEHLNVDLRLTQSILKYFFHIFSNDREGFITVDRFNALVKPLVDLLESEHVINGDIDIRDIRDNLVQLAVATNDLNRWQHLIELISTKCQHANRNVRLYVIATVAAAANELGKDFLPLLPPAVPFLAELLNDEDEEVEKETKKMLLKLEEIVGEPLQPYFAM